MAENYFLWQETLYCDRIFIVMAQNFLLWQEMSYCGNKFPTWNCNFPVKANWFMQREMLCSAKNCFPVMYISFCHRHFIRELTFLLLGSRKGYQNATKRVISTQNFAQLFNPSLEESSNFPGKYPTLVAPCFMSTPNNIPTKSNKNMNGWRAEDVKDKYNNHLHIVLKSRYEWNKAGMFTYPNNYWIISFSM